MDPSSSSSVLFFFLDVFTHGKGLCCSTRAEAIPRPTDREAVVAGWLEFTMGAADRQAGGKGTNEMKLPGQHALGLNSLKLSL